MKGTVVLPVGKFHITEQVWLDLRATDLGTCVSICDARINRRYTVIIGEGATIRLAEVDKFGRDQPDPELPNGEPIVEPVRLARMKPTPAKRTLRLTVAKSSHIKFILCHGTGHLKRNIYRVIGGYRSGKHTLILFRAGHVFLGARDGIVRIAGRKAFDDVPEGMRLPDEEWERFIALPDGSPFRLSGRVWKKVSLAELGYLDGKTFFDSRPARPR
jgi:hypothetical protein